MTPKTYNMTMVRGDTYAFQVDLSDLDATVESLAFTVKKRATDTASVIALTIGHGVTETDTKIYTVRVAPEDTSGVAAGRYAYDIQVGLGNDIYTPLMGMLTIIQDVTEN